MSTSTRETGPASWNPSLIVFACNWCSYAGADTAGVSRIQHQPHFRMIRVMCSGRVHPGFVLRAFEKGADGVLVSGCHFGVCILEPPLFLFQRTGECPLLVAKELAFQKVLGDCGTIDSYEWS